MNEIEIKGGAAFGLARSNRFTVLKVSKEKLEINAQIIGRVVFQPSDVISIEPTSGGFSLPGRGIRINHTVAGYRKKILFHTNSTPEALIETIRKIGFLDNKQPLPYPEREQLLTLQAGGSFPIKTRAIVAIIVIWNIASLANLGDLFDQGGLSIYLLSFARAFALVFMFLVSLLTLISAPFRALIMKEGHNVKDIRLALFFLMGISIAIFVMSTILPAVAQR